MLAGGMYSDCFKAIIPLSPAWTIPEMARQGKVFGIEFDPKYIPGMVATDSWELSGSYIRVAQSIDVEYEISKYEGPVLIIHGDEDESVPYSCAQRALKLYKNASLITIHGDDHCYTRHLNEMTNALKEFFVQNMPF